MVRYLGGTGCALWALMMALRPDPGFSAPWPWMGLFWCLQIGVGLAVLQSVFYLLSRTAWLSHSRLWLLFIGSGVVGSALLAPLYWLIGEGLMQQTLGFPVTIDDDDDFGIPLAFGLRAVLQEFGDIVGQVTAAWVLISWPRLPGLLPPLVLPQPDPPLPEPAVPPPPQAAAPPPQAGWRTALPSELGSDLIAVCSELQYLRVWTTRGTALVLGALQEVEEAEGAAGMRIHRSWWVHARHVRGVRRSGAGAVCKLSDGREIPVSRRRKLDVLARFGDGARYDVAAAPSATPTQRPGSKLPAQANLD
jgi:hypothetical protein